MFINLPAVSDVILISSSVLIPSQVWSVAFVCSLLTTTLLAKTSKPIPFDLQEIALALKSEQLSTLYISLISLPFFFASSENNL